MSTSDHPPKRTEKIQLMLDEDELEAIDKWRFEFRLPSRSAAVRELVRRGLLQEDAPLDPAKHAASGDFRVTEAPEDD